MLNGGFDSLEGGRNLLSVVDPDLVNALEALVSPTTRGDPMSPSTMDLQEYAKVG